MPVSSLWTPGGEVPVDRSRGAAQPPPAPEGTPSGAGGAPSEAELAAQAAELQRFLLEAPAEEIVAQHAMGLYELAVIHLSQPEPRLADARLAIDALASTTMATTALATARAPTYSIDAAPRSRLRTRAH